MERAGVAGLADDGDVALTVRHRAELDLFAAWPQRSSRSINSMLASATAAATG
jgi:hypothetical protein